MNRDDARRDAILGITDAPLADGGTNFFGLDAPRFAQLMREQFLAPDEYSGGGPTAREVLAFLQCWPEASAHGHTLEGAHHGSVVAIEGVVCDLFGVPDERAQALRAAFDASFGEVGVCHRANDWLYAHWGWGEVAPVLAALGRTAR